MTSEQTLKLWLEAIKEGNGHTALAYTQKTWLANHGETAQKDLEGLVVMGIQRFVILKTEQISPVMMRHEVAITHRDGKSKVQLMSICEWGAYQPAVSGSWGINPASWRRLGKNSPHKNLRGSVKRILKKLGRNSRNGQT